MVSFVILHYKNLNDTLECIDSIKKNSVKGSYSIIVVDNGTLLDNEKAILLKYTKDILCLNSNLGFARGNNEGARYAIKKYKPDFLCVLNNDVIINQNQFINEIYSIYQKTNFDILGPKIITNNGDSVNPFYAYQSIDEIDKKIKYSERIIKIYKSKILRNILLLYMKIKHLIIPIKKLKNGTNSCYNVALHGCCLIFSSKYYKKFKDIFYPETFLYHEEEFLEYRRKKNNLITYYDANLEIFHKEGASLDNLFNGNYNYEKVIFRNKEIIKSLKLLRDVIIKNKNI